LEDCYGGKIDVPENNQGVYALWCFIRKKKNYNKSTWRDGGWGVKKIVNKEYKYPILLRKWTSDFLIYNAIIIQKEYEFETEESPNIIIDAGANIGMASIYFATKYKNAKIIAIEPEEENYKLLKLNTAGYKNISTVNAALWNRSGEIALFATDFTNTLGYMTETNRTALKPSYKQKRLVKAITIEEIMCQFNIDHIDILKIDIEGSEKEVFESCENWLNRTNSIIIELHERKKNGCNRAFYCNTNGFDNEWIKGENIYLTRNNYIKSIL
jgi:FkbM family methyltransferase